MRGLLCDLGNRWFGQKHSARRSKNRSTIASFARGLRCECLEQRALLNAGGLSPETSPFDTMVQAILADEADPAPQPAYAAGEILIKLAERNLGTMSLSLEQATQTTMAAMGPELPTASLSGLLSMYGIGTPEAIFPRASQSNIFQTDTQSLRTALDDSGDSIATASDEDDSFANRSDLDRWYKVSVSADADIEAMVAAFEAVAEVEYAEPNYEWGLTDEIPTVIEGLPDGTTDPDYDTQWYHTNAKIPNAWNYLNTNGVYPGGNRDVVVAVIDTGVDYTHEELAANMWVNPDEIPGNDIDDDGNGFVDDVHGCSVVSDGRSHAGDPVDFHGHGTHVAGIIAAQGFNDEGGVGVAFNTQIMAIRAAQYSGTLTMQDISEGILYAVDNGAEVINMSFGGYSYSQIVADALEVALNQCVLVAAAGNDGADVPCYPARFPYVIGVAASTTQDKIAWFSNPGDVMAPGVSIYSTLPGDSYAAWSGTSMAAPVVSGVAALMRSYFWQRDIYSSRFIMGSIVASSIKKDITTGGSSSSVVDAYRALTEPPTPGVSLYENWLFDDAAIDVGNDGDGRVDSGETLHLAVELFNRSGSAENVTAVLTAQAQGAVMPDPYVTITTDTINFGDIGPFAMADNGLIWDTEGVITGVDTPFVFTVSPDCPNDHVIPFVLTTTFEDGWSENHSVYTRVSRFNYIVQRGRNIPNVISEDTELTSDEYWIVGGPVLIEEGATLTIREGTQVQWGAISDDPYNPGPQTGYMIVRGNLVIEGTQQNPVSLFPSYLVTGQTVDITVEGGNARMSFVEVINPELSGFSTIAHGFFIHDNYIPKVIATEISDSIFYKFHNTSAVISARGFETCLFDNGWVTPSTWSSQALRLGPVRNKIYNSVYLPDNQNGYYPGVSAPSTFIDGDLYLQHPQVIDGQTYAVVFMKQTSLSTAEAVANYYGGHVASITSQEEEAAIGAFLSGITPMGSDNRYYIGLSDDGHPGTYTWLDGSSQDYMHWAANYPVSLPSYEDHVVYYSGGGWINAIQEDSTLHVKGTPNLCNFFVVRLPGELTQADLDQPYNSGQLEQYVRERYSGTLRYDAYLSNYWDPNISHWMRISGYSQGPTSDNSNSYCSMMDNYWGTDSTTLIDHAIVDYYDNFTWGRVDYQPASAHGFESTYPFVESVLINGIPTETVPEIGAGQTTFTINFNRDMDPTVQPFVTFGPSSPHTDFTVHPIGGNDAGYNDNVVEFTVSLSLACDREVEVDYATMDGTAIGGIDFEITSGTLTFEPGQTQKTIEVPILGDIWEEADKNFSVRLSDPTFVTLADDTAIGTLVDDDPTLAIGDVTVLEGDAETSNAVFTVTLSAAKDETVTVEFETQDGTAVAGVHYEEVCGSLTFAPGELTQTITVPVIGNTTNDGDRNFSVQLLHPPTG